MDTDAKGQVGGIDSTEASRRAMARESGAWRCGVCGKTNAEVMREREELAREMEGEKEEEEVPEELRLAYREDLAEEAKASSSGSGGGAAQSEGAAAVADATAPGGGAEQPPAPPAPVSQAPTVSTPPRAAPGAPAVPAPTRAVPAPTRTVPVVQLQRQQQRLVEEGVPSWIDKAIYGVLGALAFMILRKFF